MDSNLVVIMSDEHQARAMGCAGHPFVRTPCMDRLAATGLRFVNAYTPSPICVPARASFATGLPVHKTRLWDNAMPYEGSIPGWGHALQRAGVAVESIGKLHYRAEEDPAGFDIEHLPMMVHEGVGMVWASIRKEDERVLPTSRMLGRYIGPGESPYTRYDRAVAECAVDWIRAKGMASAKDASDSKTNSKRKPWCLFVGFVAPHFPLVVAREFFDLYTPHITGEVKLHPRSGYRRHPWVEKQNALMDSEALFEDEAERLRAFAAYYGLVSSLDRHIESIVSALKASGLEDNTTIAYTSDHGDNLGTRGLWGKSTLYEESAAIPLILNGPGIAPGICETPVSLLDLASTIPAHFSIDFPCEGENLLDIAAKPAEPYRPILSQYHAAGAVSGAFMLRKGRWKFIDYIDFEPELFDLENDPEELEDLASDPKFRTQLETMSAELREMIDPEAVDALAFADQAALIEFHGGREKALRLGAPAATPVPKAALGDDG
ncbi:sulfatase-like hydrolase/transferase [Thioalkalivibrio sp. HK1]|uniref:sulfatase-like hydrolase/transferase n=1 Tax=Thioalkalivibrio sp. HK1 TaxID=1469245 RepID=UPI00047224D6|nr:sulfatase-like hydrolase/transferase [Thioalkalivibrio sp. HK1]